MVARDPQKLLRIVTDAKALADPAATQVTTDLLGAVAAHPDRMLAIAPDPDDADNSKAIAAILNARNAVLAAGAQPMPANIRAALQNFFAVEVLDSVRWSTRKDVLQGLPDKALTASERDDQAIGLINVIVFRDPTAIGDVTLWGHLLFHMQQLHDWNVSAFARRWTTAAPEVERQAIFDEQRIRELLIERKQPILAPVGDTAGCVAAGPSVATCDLYAAVGRGPIEFTVAGAAQATGTGGSLGLVLVAGERACNAKAGDKAAGGKALQLEGFSCTLTLAPGEMRRVYLLAPGTKAQAVATSGSVTVRRVGAE